MNRFENKVAVITGGSSGIGKATARRFMAEGASVVLNDLDAGALREVAAELGEDRVHVVQGDASQSQFVRRLVGEAVARFGRLDVMHANAGVVVSGPFEDATDADIDKVLAVDVKGVMYAARESFAELKKTKGSMVVTSSVSGLGGDWGMAIYNAAKGAVSNLVRSLALGFGADGVRVNAVNPGLTKSGMTEGALDSDAHREAHLRRIPLNRAAEPEDVAGVVAFLASDDARFVTGVNLPVDGGLSASNGQPNFTAM